MSWRIDELNLRGRRSGAGRAGLGGMVPKLLTGERDPALCRGDMAVLRVLRASRERVRCRDPEEATAQVPARGLGWRVPDLARPHPRVLAAQGMLQDALGS